MSLIITGCHSLPYNVIHSHTMSHGITHCQIGIRWCHTVSVTLSHNVTQCMWCQMLSTYCCKLPHNVTDCHTVSLTVRHFHTVSHSVPTVPALTSGSGCQQ